jgi:hypothetical protein
MNLRNPAIIKKHWYLARTIAAQLVCRSAVFGSNNAFQSRAETAQWERFPPECPSPFPFVRGPFYVPRSLGRAWLASYCRDR